MDNFTSNDINTKNKRNDVMCNIGLGCGESNCRSNSEFKGGSKVYTEKCHDIGVGDSVGFGHKFEGTSQN